MTAELLAGGWLGPGFYKCVGRFSPGVGGGGGGSVCSQRNTERVAVVQRGD